MNVISEITVGALVLIGSLLTVVTMIGLIRLPDTYTRSHAASKSATLGVLFILAGCLLYFWIDTGHISARLILAIVFCVYHLSYCWAFTRKSGLLQRSSSF